MTVILKNTLLKNTLLSFTGNPIFITPGLKFNINSNDADSITLNTNPLYPNRITQWDDTKSGLNISQSVAENQPLFVSSGLNGKAIARYDGTNDWLGRDSILGSDLLSANEATIFVVNKRDLLHNSRVFTFTGGTPVTISNPWGDGIVYWDAPFAARISQGGHGGKTVWSIWTFVKESDTVSRVYYNGVSLFSGSYSSTPINTGLTYNLTIGDRGTTKYNGDIAQVAIYNRKLLPSEISNIYNYLKTYWGL